MFPGIHAEVLLAIGYVAFLGAIALGLELLAKRSYRRAKRMRSSGFTYHQHLDVWECPMGEALIPIRVDLRRNVSYRAPAHACNTCGVKHRCTDSDTGREITHSSESWLETEIGRFHRGISLVLLVLAMLILAVEAVRHRDTRELVMLGGAIAVVGGTGARLWVRLDQGLNEGLERLR